MPDSARVLQLLEEALVDDRTPEDVCRDSPELLPAVRARWEVCRRLDAQLGDIFPARASSPAPDDTADADSAPGGPDLPAGLPSIPGYAVEAVLGRGGVGVVYRARHLRLRRAVAVKMLLSGAYAGRVERARLLREAQAVAALRHAHVVQVHDVGEHEGRPYFTMELMEGGTLAARLGGVPQPPGEAAALVATIAGAVEAAHRAGIVHRDLKPSNVLLAADGTPKVSDFGLAHQAGGDDDGLALTQSGARIGTPSYMAPEQAAGRSGAVGPAADVYALGAVLYEMLTGRPPFRGESAAETERQVIAEDPVPPSRLNARVPRDLETVCLKCLAKEPGRRYATAAALADDLARFQRGEPVTARRAGRAERAAKWVRRRPATAALWAGGAVVALAVGAGSLWWATDRAATARAVADDLEQVGTLHRASRWAEAKSALDRAALRLGDRGPADLRARLQRARRDVELVPRLETIRTTRFAHLGGWDAMRAYDELFRETGLGDEGTDPRVVAARVRASDLHAALVAALYEWIDITREELPRHAWLFAVLREADPDPTGWRDRALDPATWRDPAAAAAIPLEPDLGSRSVEQLLAVVDPLRNARGDTVSYLVRVQRAHPGNFWANLELGREMREAKNYPEAIRYGQAAVALRPGSGPAREYLAQALGEAGRLDESITELREALAINSANDPVRSNLGSRLAAAGRHEEAVRELEASLAGARDVVRVHCTLGSSLEALGRPDEAAQEYRRAIESFRDFVSRPVFSVPPLTQQSYRLAQGNLRAVLLRQGRWAEMLAAWRADLDVPRLPEERNWVGYAECCLFVGRVDEYHAARRLLLERFEGGADPREWEYAGRTCLLVTPPEDDLRRATAMIDRALATQSPRRTWLYPYIRAAKGVAEYRAGHHDAAVAIMEGDAADVPGPLPQLVVAMARWRLDQPAEARRSLARAVVSFDWSPRAAAGAGAADAWMYHVLRREAEAMMLPELPAFLEGRHQARDDDERLAMTAACQYGELHAAHARLWADAAAANPEGATPGRQYAVRAAALAGCGVGKDAAALTEADRAALRGQAREWFRAELAAAASDTAGAAQAKDRATLMAWTVSPDLACVRDAAALARLPAAEQREWAALWEEAALLLRGQKKN